MTTLPERLQDVLAAMREASPQCAAFADRLEAAQSLQAEPELGAMQVELECIEGWLLMASEPIGMECCGQGNPEHGCCGNGVAVYENPADVFSAMGRRHAELVAMIAASPAPAGG